MSTNHVEDNHLGTIGLISHLDEMDTGPILDFPLLNDLSWEEDDGFTADGGIVSGLSSPVRSPRGERAHAEKAMLSVLHSGDKRDTTEGDMDGPVPIVATRVGDKCRLVDDMELQEAIEEVTAAKTEQDNHHHASRTYFDKRQRGKDADADAQPADQGDESPKHPSAVSSPSPPVNCTMELSSKGQDSMEDMKQELDRSPLDESMQELPSTRQERRPRGSESLDAENMTRELAPKHAQATRVATTVVLPLLELPLALPAIPEIPIVSVEAKTTTPAEVERHVPEGAPRSENEEAESKSEPMMPEARPEFRPSSTPVVLAPPELPLAPQLMKTEPTETTSSTSAVPSIPAVEPAQIPPAIPTPKPIARPTTKRTSPNKTGTSKRSLADREDFQRYANMTRDKLRQELKVRGLSVSGTKSDLYQRLIEAILKREQAEPGASKKFEAPSEGFSPFSPFTPVVSSFSSFNGKATAGDAEEADFDIPLEESLYEELRRREERKKAQSLSRRSYGEDEGDGLIDDMSSDEDSLADSEMQRKEDSEGLQQASQLNGIVIVNDKIPRHLRTDDRYYYCKHCDRAWPKTSFKNAQQFGAHCSNCARRQIKRPSLSARHSVSFSPIISGPSRTRSLRLSDEAPYKPFKLVKNPGQPMTLGRMKPENRSIFLWFDALPTDLILRIFSFLEAVPRDLGAVSASCHFFSIIAASDVIWRSLFEKRWGSSLASRYSGSWKERFASRALFLKGKYALPPPLSAPSSAVKVADDEAIRLKESWNALLEDPKLKPRRVESVLSVSHPAASSEGTKPVYLVQWTPLDENEGAVEERQRWVTEESMTTAPVVSLLSSMSKRRTSEKRSRSVEGRDNLDEEDYSEGEVGSCKRTRDMLDDSEDEDDSESDAEPQRRKFEEGPLAREARMRREQRRRESRARKRPRKSRRVEGDDSSNSNNDDVPLTKEDKERQQKEFLRVLYNNRDYKPVILFFDRNA